MEVGDKIVINKGSNSMVRRVNRKKSQVKALVQVAHHRKAIASTVIDVNYSQLGGVAILTPM